MASTSVADKIKLWLFPGLVSILGLIIWSDLQTIKTKIDVNTSQTTTDKANITNLENRMNKVEAIIFKPASSVSKTSKHFPPEPIKDTLPIFTKLVATKPDERFVLAKIMHRTPL